MHTAKKYPLKYSVKQKVAHEYDSSIILFIYVKSSIIPDKDTSYHFLAQLDTIRVIIYKLLYTEIFVCRLIPHNFPFTFGKLCKVILSVRVYS